MERQKSFTTKPIKLLVFFLSIPSSLLLLFFLFPTWLLSSTHFQPQPIAPPTSNSSVNGIKNPTLVATHLKEATSPQEAALCSDSGWKDSILTGDSYEGALDSANGRKDEILTVTHVEEDTSPPEEAPGEASDGKDGILAGDSPGGSLDSIIERKDAILSTTGAPEEGLDLVGERRSADVVDARPEESNESSSHGASVNMEKKSEKESASACDVSSGRWVFDESYPLYTSRSCPFIDEGFSCEANGRMDGDYMKWRWQPHQCRIPRFNPVEMLELIRGKRLVFVGDSINRNQWESLLCLLVGAISDPSRLYEARGRKITKGKGVYNFKFKDYHCSVEYYVSHYLVHESKARVGQRRVKTLRIDTMDRSSSRWRGADIIVFNTAHWWSHYKTKSGLNYYQEGDQVHPRLHVSTAFRKALTTWATWVDRHATPGKTQVFFRSSAPTHFSGGEWNSGGHCKDGRQPLNDTRIRKSPEKNLIIEEVVKQMRTPVTILNITNLSGLRIDGHPSVYGKNPGKGPPSNIQDCSHWCLPGVPDTWNELLYYYLLTRMKSASAN